MIDFTTVEAQAGYFSEERSVRRFDSNRRPDFRSSAQKQLMLQSQFKVPVFRQWFKKFFVVMDTQFFRALPQPWDTTRPNSEVTWLSNPIVKAGNDYALGDVYTVYSEWDEVRNALCEERPPEPDEILAELQAKLTAMETQPASLES